MHSRAGRSNEKPAHAERWLFGAFAVLLVWAPIPLGSDRPWAWSLLELGIFALAAIWLGLYALGQARFSSVCRRAWWALALFAAWLAVVLVQIVPLPLEWVAAVSPASADPEASRVFMLKSLAYILAFCLTLVLVHDRDRLRTLTFVLVGSGLAQAIYASFMHLTGTDFELFYTPLAHSQHTIGTFVNRNHLAGYLEMTLAIGIGAMIATLRSGSGTRTWRQRFRDWLAWTISPKILLRAMLVVMVIALVMTRSRMGNAAFFSSTLAAGVLGLLLSRHATRQTVALLASLIVIDIFIVGSWFGVEKVVQRIEHTTMYRTAVPGEESMEERAEPGLHSLEILRAYPWLGSGGGTFYVAFPEHRQKDIIGFFDHAHNDYAQFASETGVVGIGLLGLLVLGTLFIALKTQHQRQDELSRGVAFGVSMGIISLMIHSWVDFNLQIPANALTFVVMLAMGWAAYSVERHSLHAA
jgi:putative inorganic carbon (HCO3(-)) transporter